MKHPTSQPHSQPPWWVAHWTIYRIICSRKDYGWTPPCALLTKADFSSITVEYAAYQSRGQYLFLPKITLFPRKTSQLLAGILLALGPCFLGSSDMSF